MAELQELTPDATEADLGSTLLPVEAGKAVELARAVHATGRWFLDRETARDHGFADVVAVPTFPVVTAHHEVEGINANTRAIERLGFDARQVLLGACRFEYLRPLVAGDVLTARSTIALVDRRTGGRSGPMTRITVSTVLTHRAGDAEACRQEVTLLHVPGMFGPAGAPATTGREAPPGRGDHDLGLVTRTGIVRYAGASGDFNPVHHDEVHARSLGLPGVFAMGLYPAGVAAVRVLDEAAQPVLRRLEVRFLGRVWPGDRLVLHRHDAGTAVVRAGEDDVLRLGVELADERRRS